MIQWVKGTPDFWSSRASGHMNGSQRRGVFRCPRTSAWHCVWGTHERRSCGLQPTPPWGCAAQVRLHVDEGLSAGRVAEHSPWRLLPVPRPSPPGFVPSLLCKSPRTDGLGGHADAATLTFTNCHKPGAIWQHIMGEVALSQESSQPQKGKRLRALVAFLAPPLSINCLGLG